MKQSPNRLYVLNLNLSQPMCLLAKVNEAAWLWHARYGHLNFRALRSMSRQELVERVPNIEHVDQLCKDCMVGKQHRVSLPRNSAYRAEKPLELLHGDLCSPITLATPSGNKYFSLVGR